jgi:DNA-binding response OmpR family regulator
MQHKILTVEDSFEVRLALEMALTEEGYDVLACPDGESGWQGFLQFDPDLALLDLRMPGINGIEVCRRIREVSNIPIMIFSAVEDRAEKIEAFESGADDYVVKGTGIDELLVRVVANLRWKRVAAPGLEEAETPPLEPETAGLWHDLGHGARGTGPGAGDRAGKGGRARSSQKFPRIRIPRYEGEKGSAVLVADPDPDARDRLARLCQRLGFPVIETADGRQTLRTIGRYLPWLVLCELVMPDMNGPDILKLVFEHPRTKNVAMVVVSSKGSPEARAVASQFGALDYIVKPWTEDEVSLRVQWAKQSLERKKALLESAA